MEMKVTILQNRTTLALLHLLEESCTKILCRQQMLQKKRSKKKLDYNQHISIEVSKRKAKISVTKAKRQLNKRPYLLWKNEFDWSMC